MINEPWLIEWLPRIRGAGSRLAFDNGANDGTWTTTLRHLFAHVVALEPDLRCSPPPGHTYDRRAVAATSGTATLYQRVNALQSSLLVEHAVGDGTAVVSVVNQAPVATVTLDQLAAEYGPPEFVKIDIEGGEVEALQGARAECWRSCVWVIELHDTREDVCREIQRLGYEHVMLMPHPHVDAGKGHEWLFAAQGIVP